MSEITNVTNPEAEGFLNKLTDFGIKHTMNIREVQTLFDLTPDNGKFFQWFNSAIDKHSNALSISEERAMHHIVRMKSRNQQTTLGKNLEDIKVEEVDQKFLDVDKNLFEKNVLEHEIERLTVENAFLDRQISKYEKLNKFSQVGTVQLNKQEIDAKVYEKQMEQCCLAKCEKLDKANKDLAFHLKKCSESLIKMDQNDKFISKRISTISCKDLVECKLENYIEIEKQGITDCDDSIYDQIKVTDLCETALLTSKISSHSNGKSKFDESVKDIEVRIAQSIYDSILSKCILLRLRANSDYVDVYESRHDNLTDLDEGIENQKALIEMLLIELETVAKGTSNSHTLMPRNVSQLDEINLYKEKNNYLKSITSMYTNIMANRFLIYLLYKSEITNLKELELFFRDFYGYVTNDVNASKERSKYYVVLKNELSDYMQKPFLQRYKILDDMILFVHGKIPEKCTMLETCEILQGFRHELLEFEKQIFDQSFHMYRMNHLVGEQTIRPLANHLKSGPTNELVALPFDLLKLLRVLKRSMEDNDNLLRSAVNICLAEKAKITENKWFNIRQQLWKWFLIDPQRIIRYIEEIQEEIRIRRNADL